MTIYKLRGANKLPEGANEANLITLGKPAITARLTTDPEAYFLHIDKSAAVGTQLLKGIFAPDKDGTPEESLAAEIEGIKARRTRKTSQGVFIVFDGETDVSNSEFKYRVDTDDFAVCMDAIAKPEIRESFRPTVQSVVTAFGLTLPENVDHGIEEIGDVVYLVDPDGGKPIYTFTLAGGSARASIASPLTENLIAQAAALAPKLVTDGTMTRRTSLLVNSLDDATDNLQAFIAAWAALEIFVTTTFKSIYKEQWFKMLKNCGPDFVQPVLKHFGKIDSGKYVLADKFVIIASVLDSAAAGSDDEEFRNLKKTRDRLFHGDSVPSPLPTEAVQKLILKYMKLHLDPQE